MLACMVADKAVMGLDFKRWKDYIPCSSRPSGGAGASSRARGRGACGAEEGLPEDAALAEEEFREDLNLTAEPEGTTAFKRKNVMLGLGVVALVFTCAFIYGISTASTANKHKAEADRVEAADQATHLKDAPKSYADDRNRQYEKKERARENAGNGSGEKISRMHDDGTVEYVRPAARSVPAYTPVPQSTYRPRTAMPAPALPNVGTPVASGSHGGLTPQQKIEAERAKEKMAANESPIGFALKDAEKEAK